MKGLIIKEILGLRQYLRVLGFLLLAYGAMAYIMRTTVFIPVVNAFLIMICVLNSSNYDDNNRWEQFVLTLPVSKSDLVTSKYLFILLLCIASTGITLVLSLSLSLLFPASLTTILIASVASAFAGLFLASLSMPIIYRYGTEKARCILIIIIMVPTLLLRAFSDSLNKLCLPSAPVLVRIGSSAAAFVVVFALLSYGLSQKLFAAREL